MRRISVITVCLNPGADLERTLASVRAQRYPDIEHVVVDGGSSDGSLELLTTYRPEILVSEPDEGIYPAMNKGVRLASGDIIHFLNAGDEFFDRDVLGDVINFFEETGCDATFGNLLPIMPTIGSGGNHPAFRAGRVIDFSYFNNRRRFYDECIHHQATFYTRAIFDKCSLLCDCTIANGEYHLNMCAFVRYGYSLKHMPRTVVRFLLGGHSTSDFNIEWRRFTAARDKLRSRFFSGGPKVYIQTYNEYLLETPTLTNRIRSFTRAIGYYSRIVDFRFKVLQFLRALGEQ